MNEWYAGFLLRVFVEKKENKSRPVLAHMNFHERIIY